MNMDFYNGSYTRTGGPGVGKCRLEGDKLSLLCNDPLPNSSYVILNKKQDKLFAICSDPVQASEGGSVASYDLAEGGLRQISRQDTLGAGPCHLCFSPDEKFLYTANYFTGSLSVFAVDEDGKISPIMQHICHEGKSVHPVRQTGPHAHQVTLIPGTNLVCCVDLGLDALMVYQPDEKTGMLKLYSRTDVPGGFGPRHLIHAKHGITYLACEVGNQAISMRWNGEKFDLLQILSTLPEGYEEKNTASAIRLNSDESKVMISNRGHDSIAIYDLDKQGGMKLNSIVKTSGGFPRDFALLDDETMLIGHQEAKLTLEKFVDGKLELVSDLDIKGCICTLIP